MALFTARGANAIERSNSGVSALLDALNVIHKERERRGLARFYGTTALFTLGGVRFVLLAVVVLPVALNLFGVAAPAERILRCCAGRRSSRPWCWAWRWSTATARAAAPPSGAG
jgi:hypothetical protein